MAKESQDETYVRRLLEERYGLNLRKLDEERDAKTPDYELIDDGVRAAIAEIKTLGHVERSEAKGWKVERHTPFSWSASRTDNGPSRVSDHVHAAAKQLRRFETPRVLILLNQEPLLDVHDLEEAVHGYLPYGNEESGYFLNTASMRIAEGRIREDRWIIDLYLWIEPRKGPRTVFPVGGPPEYIEATEPTVTFRVTSERGLAVAHTYFGCPADLPRPTWPDSIPGVAMHAASDVADEPSDERRRR